MSNLNLNMEFCCTCLKIGTLGDKFVRLCFAPPEDISYTNKLKSCVPEMGLENVEDCFLCKPCSAALETAYTFRCMCLRTENRLGEFRMAQNKSSCVSDKNIKQELIESCVGEQDSVECTKAYSTGSKEILPTASVSTSPESFQMEPQELCQTSSDEPEQLLSNFPRLQEQTSIDRDSKIEIVKDELGSLLTESLGSAIDINIHIFDEQTQRSRKISSKVDINNSLNAEIKQIENNSYKLGKTIKSHILEESKQPLKTEDEGSVNNFVVASQLQKGLSDAEIVEICCKTIPELHNCPPEALDCQVTVEKIEITEIPVKIPTEKQPVFKKFKGKPFWCTICHKDVHRRDRFNAHILRHSNIRAYKCNICKQGFFSSDTLNKHKKSCVALSSSVIAENDGSAGSLLNTPVSSNATSSSSPAISPKLPKQKILRKITNGVKVRKIPLLKKKIVIKTEEGCTEIQNSDEADIEKSKNARKSTRQHTPSKKLSNMNDTVFRCKQCNYQSYYKQKYQVHLLHHTNSRPFSCSECPKKFYERWELNRHIRNCHSQNNKITTRVPSNSAKKQMRISRDDTPNPESSCSDWETNYLPSLLEPAVSLIVNPGMVVTPIIQSIHSLAETSTPSIEMSFSCKVCNISFKSRNLLMLHTQTHELRHTCEVCQQGFLSETEFLEHVQTHDFPMETNESVELELPPKIPKKKKRKKFFCNVCDMEFASRDHANVHTGARPYPCKVCGKQFAAYTTLRKHKLTHQDRDEPTHVEKKGKHQASPQRKTFSCEICQKKFVKKEHVYSHNCQNASGDSVYRCQICKNAFIGRAALIEHMGMHVNQSGNPTE